MRPARIHFDTMQILGCLRLGRTFLQFTECSPPILQADHLPTEVVRSQPQTHATWEDHYVTGTVYVLNPPLRSRPAQATWRCSSTTENKKSVRVCRSTLRYWISKVQQQIPPLHHHPKDLAFLDCPRAAHIPSRAAFWSRSLLSQPWLHTKHITPDGISSWPHELQHATKSNSITQIPNQKAIRPAPLRGATAASRTMHSVPPVPSRWVPCHPCQQEVTALRQLTTPQPRSRKMEPCAPLPK